MEWLLILSALLNAATGAFTGTCAPDTSVRHEAAAEAVAIVDSVASAVVTLATDRPANSTSSRPAEIYPSAFEPVIVAATVETDSLIE